MFFQIIRWKIIFKLFESIFLYYNRKEIDNMTEIKQKIDIAVQRTKVLKQIQDLKTRILPLLHKDYVAARKDLTSVITHKNQFSLFDIILFRYRYKKLKSIYLFTIELYHNMRAYLKTLV